MAYKLTYFNIAALGEPIRYLFHYGNIEFEDNRCKFEDWPKLKPQTPYGQVPLLEYNGKVIHQSTAICRYLAKKVGLVGNDEWEDLEIDAIVDTVNDLRTRIQKYYYEKDESVKKYIKGPLFDEIVPFYQKKLEEEVKKNGGYLVGGKLTWADIHFVAQSDYLKHMLGKDIFEGLPTLSALREKVNSIPAIKKYLQNRPKSVL